MESATLEVKLQRGKIDTFKVPFKNGWVELKEQLNVRDRSLVNQSTVTGKIIARSGAEEEVEMGALALGNSQIQTLVQAIMAWGGPAFCVHDHRSPAPAGHEHQPLELTVENIAILPDPVSEILLDEINKRNPRGVRSSPNPTNGAAGKN